MFPTDFMRCATICSETDRAPKGAEKLENQDKYGTCRSMRMW